MTVAILAGLLTVAVQILAQQKTDNRQICAVGHAALQDLRILHRDKDRDAYFSARVRKYHPVLLDACPKLKNRIPRMFKIATEFDEEVADSKDGPIRIIYTIGVPQMNVGKSRATITMGLRCGFMCGSGYEVAYRREKNIWRMEGTPRLVATS